MTLRSKIIAALVVCELAIVGEAVVAIRGGGGGSSPALGADGWGAPNARLVEDGPHQVFVTGDHPALHVDIGYADLTIVTGGPEIDVGLSKSTSYGFFRATAPIAAQRDGDTIRVTTEQHGMSTGDDRMVTVVVPPGTEVTIAAAGDIKVNGLRANASIKSVGNGDVSVDDYDASTLDVASSGRISMHQVVASHIDVRSDGDKVEATALNVRDGSIEGDDPVTLGFAPGSDTLVSAETNDGDINLSGFSGTPASSSGHKNSDSASETVRIGAAKGHLDVHSSDGDITLTQED